MNLRITLITASLISCAIPAQEFIETTGAISDTFNVVGPDTHVADMDGDGMLDIVFLGSTVFIPPLYIAWGDGRGRFETKAILGPAPNRCSQLTIGDVDGDGDLDLLATETPFKNYIIINHGNRVFADESPQRLPTLALADHYGASMGDLDGDGDLDIVGGYRTRGLSGLHGFVWINDGSGKFTDKSQQWGVTNIAIGYDHPASRLVFADIDRDGDLDVISRGNDLKLLINHGTSLVDETAARLSVPATGSGGAVNLEDTDQDGDLDLFLGPGSLMGRMYYYNDGQGFFTEAPSTDIPMFYPAFWPLGPAIAIHFVDIDGDGDRDLLAPYSHWTVHPHDIFLNDGKGKFSFPTKPYLPLKNSSIDQLIPADLDGDGDIDIVRTIGAGIHWMMSNTLRQIASQSPPKIGSTYKLDVYGNPGLTATVYVGFQASELILPPFGRFGLNPQSAVLLTTASTIPPLRKQTFSIPVPSNPSLTGLTIFCQAALIDTAKFFDSRFTNVMEDKIQ